MRAFLVFSGIFLSFHLLFWQQGMGVNLPLFVWFTCTFIYTRKRPALNKTHWFLISTNLVSGVALVFLHSNLSLVVFLLSSVSLVGSLHQLDVSVVEGLVNSIWNLFTRKEGLIPGLSANPTLRKQRGYVYLRVAVFPVFILFLYILLFSAGNTVFAGYTEGFLQGIGRFFEHFSSTHLAFLFLAFLLTRWAVRSVWSTRLRLSPGNTLLRQRKKNKLKNLGPHLKIEHYRAVVLFSLLNALFLFINFIDVKWVWFSFSIREGFNLKAFVHEGTGYLLVCLLLSIALVLYFFRKNLNFYPNNRLLKTLAFAWIVQNALLAISVAIRTGHYINFHGLASKRIGLLIFISMVLFGLFSLWVKIAQKRNFAYLMRVNSAFILGALTVSACFSWDRIVLTHNLAHHNPHEIDVDHYLDLDPSVYPLLYQNLQTVEDQIAAHQNNKVKWIQYEDIHSFKHRLDMGTQSYLEKEARQKIWSWNWPDARASRKLALR